MKTNQDNGVIVAVAMVALCLFLLLIVSLFMLIDYYDSENQVKTGQSANASAVASLGNPGAVGTSSNVPTKRRTYFRGVRLEELLNWTASEATEALASYATLMEGDEREALFSTLPLIANRVLGLDVQPGAPKGWLNEQATHLVEPNKNVRAATQLQQRVLDLLAAAAPAGGAVATPTAGTTPARSTSPARTATTPPGPTTAAHAKSPGSAGLTSVLGTSTSSKKPEGRMKHGILFEKLLDAGRAPEGGVRFTFFSRHLPPPARFALNEGKPPLVPPLFAARLQPHAWSRPPGSGEDGLGLVLAAWEYFLFCFCLWPLSDGGERDRCGDATAWFGTYTTRCGIELFSAS